MRRRVVRFSDTIQLTYFRQVSEKDERFWIHTIDFRFKFRTLKSFMIHSVKRGLSGIEGMCCRDKIILWKGHMEMSYNNEEQVNYTISKDMNPDEHKMVTLADFMGDKIAVKRGNASLPWITNRLQEAESKVAEVRAYVYTIYRLNAIEDEEIDRFNGKPLEKWRCLPVFADLVIPAAVKYDDAGKYEDLLDRSIYTLDSKFFNKSTEYGYLMSLDQFNDFTDWVQATFNFSADQIKTFDKLRTTVNLASVKDRVSYKGKTEGFGHYPLDLEIRLHKKHRLNESSFAVTKDHVEAEILSTYKRRGGKSDPATKTE